MVNREHKDMLFRFFLNNNREYLLELYNALNDSHYTNINELIVNTLEDVIFMNMKNDMSFIIDSTLNLYEQQSTYCPNMPLRGLEYFASLIRKITKDEDIYSSKLIKIPTPKYVVFYNGLEKNDDQIVHKLSDAFERPTDDPCLECKALMLNINVGHNRELLERSKFLFSYSSFIDKFREHSKTMSKDDAANKAIDECITEGNALADFLAEYRAEVFDLMLTEYNEERHIALIRKEEREEGREEVFALLEQGYSLEEAKEFLKSGTLVVAEPKKEYNKE